MNDLEVDTDEGPMRFTDFSEFWPYYLSQHRDVRCRMFHFGGTSSAATLLVVGLLSMDGFWFLMGIVSGYAWAWFGHFKFEKNRPATFRHPVYSFVGDLKMFWMMLHGELEQELALLPPSKKK